VSLHPQKLSTAKVPISKIPVLFLLIIASSPF
jgi:hypothetical protein